MNDNSNYLSLGNVINVIKKNSCSESASQTEIFCIIFNINDINTTTINNYCIGIRAIGLPYRNMFSSLYERYLCDKFVFNGMICSLLNLLDNCIKKYTLDDINNNTLLNKVINELLVIANNDENVTEEFIYSLSGKDSYDIMIELLNYSININRQPIYKQDINIDIDKKSLEEYLKIKLYFGQSYISRLIELSNKNNSYAQSELASLYYDGIVNGYPEYDKSYEYYLKAAKNNNPKACYMVAYLMFYNYVKYDFNIMWEYLNKSIELGSASGYNTLGLCYLNGFVPDKKVSIPTAIKYFKLAGDKGYTYAFNNLGKIYESNNDMKNALKYYKISADMNESWALNKVGEYYRKNNDLSLAFIYYKKAIECPLSERNAYAYYNLANYYYKNGCSLLNIESSKEIYDEYMSMFEKLKK